MCLHVLRTGHRVIGSVRSKTKAATAVEQIEQAGGSVIELDMTESQASIASKIHALGRIDYLAACEDITYVPTSMKNGNWSL
jgi:NAD(P)-dependent dehydrogenase (short-subunit alcohol dehydrogenase family)